jgi:hypothetical protein
MSFFPVYKAEQQGQQERVFVVSAAYYSPRYANGNYYNLLHAYCSAIDQVDLIFNTYQRVLVFCGAVSEL